MKELQRHIDAFEFYFKKKQEGVSTASAISLVAVEYKFSETAVYKWKRVFDWDGREAIRAAEIQKEVEKRSDNSIIKNKIIYLSIDHALINQFKKDVRNGVAKIRNVNDYVKIVDNALLLQGERNEITEIEANIKLDQKERVRNIQDTLKKLKRKEE